MTLNDLKNKRILILGYALEGQATERFLKRVVPSAKIMIADKKDDPDYLDKQKDADIIIRTPGLPLRFIQGQHTTATNLFFEYLEEHDHKNPVIGVTGSKGKSTTASLITDILRAGGKTVHFIGNIGAPALDALIDVPGAEDIFVMELSSYQLEDCDFSPNVAVITSLFPEHLDHHGSYKEYLEAKSHIVTHQTAEDLYLFNPLYPELTELQKKTPAHSIPFPQTLPFSVEGTKLQGQHNVDNIKAATEVAHVFDIPDEIIQKAVINFQPLPHRLTNVGVFCDITFYDDAIATAPEATIFALQTLKNVDTLFLGGEDRGYHFDELARTIKDLGIHHLVFFPDSGARIEDALREAGHPLDSVLRTKDMKEAVAFAYEKTKPGSICLLSTASPSYSVWKNFEEKGDLFIRYVRELGSDGMSA